MTDEARKALALQIAERLESAFRGDLYGIVWDVRRAVEVIAEALPDVHPAAANEEIARLRAIIEAPADGPCMCDWCVATRDAANEKNARLGAALDATKEKP